MDDNKTLAQARFIIGDYIDIAITPPNPAGGGRPMHRLDRMNDHPRDRDHRDGGKRFACSEGTTCSKPGKRGDLGAKA